MHGTAHGSQVDDGWHAGKVLQDNPCRFKRNFLANMLRRTPGSQVPNILFLDNIAITNSQDRCAQHAHAVRQAGNISQALVFETTKSIEIKLAIACIETVTCSKRISRVISIHRLQSTPRKNVTGRCYQIRSPVNHGYLCMIFEF